MRWLKNGFPLMLIPQVVSVRGIPLLTRASPPSLLKCRGGDRVPDPYADPQDLPNACHHIPIKQSDQKFLCFQVDGVRYMYMVLPFGLTTAPWAFTEVVKQIKNGRSLASTCYFNTSTIGSTPT